MGVSAARSAIEVLPQKLLVGVTQVTDRQVVSTKERMPIGSPIAHGGEPSFSHARANPRLEPL
jgi:hypothetical protein